MNRNIEEIFAPKPVVKPQIYAYSIDDAAHAGQLKIGQTTRDVKRRILEQVGTAAIENFRIELVESAVRSDGSIISDHQVRNALRQKDFDNPKKEWMRCTVDDVRTVLTELRTGQRPSRSRRDAFPMRREQAEAVERTLHYFRSIWQEDSTKAPRFLWNAKMRFGKTFTAYHLAKQLGAKRVLVVTFKPAVEDAWRSDLEDHIDWGGPIRSDNRSGVL